MRYAILLMLPLVAACGENASPTAANPAPPASSPALVATSVAAFTSTELRAFPARPVPSTPTVVVTDQFGARQGNVVVDFAITAGGGSIVNAHVLTDKTGLARAGAWTLGPTEGENTLTARVQGLPPVTFHGIAHVGRVIASYRLESQGGALITGGQSKLIDGRLQFRDDGTFVQGYVYQGIAFDSTMTSGTYLKRGSDYLWGNATGAVKDSRLYVKYAGDPFDGDPLDEVYVTFP